MAGTGNDYIGTLSVTRSNRKCQSWTENTPHKVDSNYRNESLYADGSVEKARNYCRDPSRNIAGTWCYTTDPKLSQDLCDVYDCAKPEECIMLTNGKGEGRFIYIRKKWKKEGLKFWLKEWDPDLPDGISFVIRPLKGKNYYKLVVGAQDNEKVLLYYGTGEGEVLLKEKTLPHLIPIGKWGGFWLKIPTGHISLGYEGLDNYLFKWEYDKGSLTKEQVHDSFNPIFFIFTSVQGRTIGVNFPCDECHTEKTTTKHFTKILPLGLWSKEHGIKHNKLTLYIRGNGVAVIPLINLPGIGEYYGLSIGDLGNRMYFIKQQRRSSKTLKYTINKEPMIFPDKWTTFQISYNEANFEVKRNGAKILELLGHNEPMIFYWFSLGAEKGEITWSFNCNPEDIDGPPRNGHWSEWSSWTCSVTCGGGEGIRTRTCTNPAPNIYGEDCVGENMLEGDCNNFKCGEITPGTIEYIHNSLQKNQQSLQVPQGNSIKLICNQEAVKIIKKDAHKAILFWALNGLKIKSNEKISIDNDNNLAINDAQPEDSGVYTCMVLQTSGSRHFISVVSMAVEPKTATISTREAMKLNLNCHSAVLGYIYRDLSQRWEVNGEVWKDYGLTTVEAVNTVELKSVNKSHAGQWKCFVRQPDLQLEWLTNWILVEVKHAPNFLTHLMEDPLPGYLFKHFGNEKQVLMFLVTLLVFTIVIVAIGTCITIRFVRSQGRRIRKKRKTSKK